MLEINSSNQLACKAIKARDISPFCKYFISCYIPTFTNPTKARNQPMIRFNPTELIEVNCPEGNDCQESNVSSYDRD